MKRIGYISAPRIRGDLNLGVGGNAVIPGTLTVNGVEHLYGLAIMYAGLITAGTSTFGGPVIASSSLGVAGTLTTNIIACNSSLGVAGPTTLNGPVVCIGSLAIGGPLTMHQIVNALQLPAADPGVPGELWSNANVITRSA